MSLFAHVVEGGDSFLAKLLHPFTGLDHLASMALAALSITMLVFAIKGHAAATTSGTTTRIRSRLLVTGSAIALAASIALIVLV